MTLQLGKMIKESYFLCGLTIVRLKNGIGEYDWFMLRAGPAVLVLWCCQTWNTVDSEGIQTHSVFLKILTLSFWIIVLLSVDWQEENVIVLTISNKLTTQSVPKLKASEDSLSFLLHFGCR